MPARKNRPDKYGMPAHPASARKKKLPTIEMCDTHNLPQWECTVLVGCTGANAPTEVAVEQPAIVRGKSRRHSGNRRKQR